jgi:hypothetical protein
MPIYFLLLDALEFHQQIVPPLAASWQQRSFSPCQFLCQSLLTSPRSQADEGMLLAAVSGGLAFDRPTWRALVGEALLFSAAEMPQIETAPATLTCLLAPDRYRAGPAPRECLAPIEQVLHGARDLVFGTGFYRPDHAGYNDSANIARLASYLGAIDPASWQIADLDPLSDTTDAADCAEELEYVRHWFPALQDLYKRARDKGQVVVCEDM